MSHLPAKILIVDDDPTLAQGLEEPMGRNGVKIVRAGELDTALYCFNQHRFEVALIEQDFQFMPGLALIQKWRRHEVKDKRFTGFILMVGSKHNATDEALLRELGDMEAITKPFSTIQLLPYLSRAVDRRRKAESLATMVKRISILQENGASAEQIVAKVKDQLPSLGPVGINLMCEVLESGNQHEAALQLLEMMLINMPQNVTLLGRKGRVLLKMGKFEEARNLLVLADKAAPKNIERMEDLANLYLKNNQPQEGTTAFKELIVLNADEPEKKFEFFDQLSNYGYESDAMKLCSETTMPQEVVRFYNNKGVAHSKAGESDAAIKEYEKAVKYYPNHRDMHRIQFNLAVARFNRKTLEDVQLAENHINRCLELEPEFEKGKILLEKISRFLKVPKKAS